MSPTKLGFWKHNVLHLQYACPHNRGFTLLTHNCSSQVFFYDTNLPGAFWEPPLVNCGI